jgi:ribosomal protein S18 acetylase RimI-like enzyme
MTIRFISLAILFCFSAIAMEQSQETKQEYIIVDFDKSQHAETAMEICFQDPYSFFAGSSMVGKNPILTHEFFMKDGKETLQKMIDSNDMIKRILIAGQQVLGFIAFWKTREQSLESMKRLAAERNIQFSEQAILQAMPDLKKTDAECVNFAEIEAIAVHKDFRGKGYGRGLMEDALNKIKELFQDASHVCLNVNLGNDRAQKLYAAQGFEIEPQQPKHLQMMNAVQMKKTL